MDEAHLTKTPGKTAHQQEQWAGATELGLMIRVVASHAAWGGPWSLVPFNDFPTNLRASFLHNFLLHQGCVWGGNVCDPLGGVQHFFQLHQTS